MTKRRKTRFFFLAIALASLACQTVLDVLEELPAEAVRMPALETGEDPPIGESLHLEEQLEIFEELWSIVDEEYLYEDFNGVDWDAAYDEYRGRIEGGLTNEMFYYTMDEMIFSLGDDHSIFLSPEMVAFEDAEYEGEQDYVGIGVWLMPVVEEDSAVILIVFPESPAEQAGLQAYDVILAVDGGPLLDEYGYINESLLGIEGEEVTITIQSPGESPRQEILQRAQITSTIPVPYQELYTPGGMRIGYLLIPTFSVGTVADQIQEALEILNEGSALDGLILDNRLNGGGYDDVTADSLRFFTEGTVGYFVNRQGREAFRLRPRDIGGSSEVPLVVLVGPETVSFGEIFSGILKDQGRAYVIGELTDGNIETLWGYDFSDGSRAWIAHDSFRPVNNPEENWEETGIIPDLSVPVRWHQVTLLTDPAVQAALDYFDGR